MTTLMIDLHQFHTETSHLTTEEIGVHMRLLFYYHVNHREPMHYGWIQDRIPHRTIRQGEALDNVLAELWRRDIGGDRYSLRDGSSVVAGVA